MMDETKELVRRARQHMYTLRQAGVSSENAVYEGYRLTVALIKNDTKESDAMEAAAYWALEAAKQARLDRETLVAEWAAEKATAER